MTATLLKIKNALLKRGYALGHASRDRAGKVASYYLQPAGSLSRDAEIRISDHDLGATVYGEPQGGWRVNVVIDPDLSIEDALCAIDNPSYRDSVSGYSAGYSHAEWLAETGGADDAV